MKIQTILKRVSSLGKGHFFDKNSHKIASLRNPIANILGAKAVYLSDFIVAKIKGLVEKYEGHPEITDDIFSRISKTLNAPVAILHDTRDSNRDRKIFIELDPAHYIAVELRLNNRRAEINTIIPIGSKTLKKLIPGLGYELLYNRSGGTITSSSLFSQQDLSGVRTNTDIIAQDSSTAR